MRRRDPASARRHDKKRSDNVRRSEGGGGTYSRTGFGDPLAIDDDYAKTIPHFGIGQNGRPVPHGHTISYILYICKPKISCAEIE